MELQEEIIRAITDNMGQDEEENDKPLAFVKYVSRTDLIKIAGFPAVIVIAEPFESVSADQRIIGTNQECTIYLLSAAKLINEINEADIASENAALMAKYKTLVSEISKATSNLIFGKGDFYRTTINSAAFNAAQVTVKGYYKF